MSKITIKTIKSEDARFQIENYTTNGRMLSKAAISAVVKAERQAEERAAKEFEKAKEIIKAAIRLTFNGCLGSQLLERRILIFEDLISEINIGEHSDEH